MWHKEYKDYPTDTPLIQQQVRPNHGTIGCEMHDLNGWNESHHRPVKKKKRGLLASLLESWFK
jgi:hypothetical protein